MRFREYFFNVPFLQYKLIRGIQTKVILSRGDATETGHVTDCSLSPFFGLKLHSQHCTLAYGKKVNKTQPAHMSSPLNYPA
jgi:hypothetical protein